MSVGRVATMSVLWARAALARAASVVPGERSRRCLGAAMCDPGCGTVAAAHGREPKRRYSPGMPRYDPSTALIVVDVQNDFADPAGSLFVRGGPLVAERCSEEARAASAAGG